MKATTELFYTSLPVNGIDLDELLNDEALFIQVPADWHIVITDIKNSTKAVLNGQHQTVNFLATGSIVIVLNIANKMNVDVPFFFGGDGATFIVPPLIIDAVMQALSKYKVNSLNNFELELRAGVVPVRKIYDDGYELRVSKHSRSSVFSIPVVLGQGLDYAEKLIKGEDYLADKYPDDEDEPDMTGMQCRWDRIAVPEDQEEVIALLVTAREGVRQSAVLRKVIQLMDEIYGPPQQRQPISINKLRLKTSYNSLKTELLARLGKSRVLKVIHAMILNAYGYIYFRTLKGKLYLEQLVQMSDTLVIDGRINTVISGTAAQRFSLEERLQQMETAGEIYYGLHISNASIMSCYVRNMDDAHIHFVDGSDGGYTQAARMLKAKL
ncbi:DUF3095 domain-containing protein [Pedobacter sp. MR2016-24]|uniref:DUF3095 domain-containing protein n=1 Tax=Pedobacter sp. MR2016-24 TaxID=2994466 RepID=UPI0022478BB6|nr:DUF3095 domain-containing protein [Pedobacter sp. MR2016-24]MCX2482803.1 DUF3095 domain-containing protein [Pedobacter sp. MR2016-24]